MENHGMLKYYKFFNPNEKGSKNADQVATCVGNISSSEIFPIGNRKIFYYLFRKTKK